MDEDYTDRKNILGIAEYFRSEIQIQDEKIIQSSLNIMYRSIRQFLIDIEDLLVNCDIEQIFLRKNIDTMKKIYQFLEKLDNHVTQKILETIFCYEFPLRARLAVHEGINRTGEHKKTWLEPTLPYNTLGIKIEEDEILDEVDFVTQKITRPDNWLQIKEKIRNEIKQEHAITSKSFWLHYREKFNNKRKRKKTK